MVEISVAGGKRLAERSARGTLLDVPGSSSQGAKPEMRYRTG